MSWNNSDKPDFKTLDELRGRAKVNPKAVVVCDIETDSARKSKKSSSKKKNEESFVDEINIRDLEISDEEEEEEEDDEEAIEENGIEPKVTKLVDINLALNNITKDAKSLVSRINALIIVLGDISLTTIPKQVSQVVKKVEKLNAMLYDINTPSKLQKQQKKK